MPWPPFLTLITILMSTNQNCTSYMAVIEYLKKMLKEGRVSCGSRFEGAQSITEVRPQQQGPEQLPTYTVCSPEAQANESSPSPCFHPAKGCSSLGGTIT